MTPTARLTVLDPGIFYFNKKDEIRQLQSELRLRSSNTFCSSMHPPASSGLILKDICSEVCFGNVLSIM